MQLMAFDPSVRGFAFATCLRKLDGLHGPVVTGRFDGGALKRGASEGQHGARCDRILSWVEDQICEYEPDVFGFESYGWSAKPDTDVVELVGCVKKLCRISKPDVQIVTINQSGARGFLLAPDKVPRKGVEAKEACREKLGRWGVGRTLDESDALVILNDMLYRGGGQMLV